MSAVFACVCLRVGISIEMIGLPGHFLMAVRPRVGEDHVYIDAFNGGAILDRSECEQIVRRYGIEWANSMLDPILPADVLRRMVRNLLLCHSRDRSFQSSFGSNAVVLCNALKAMLGEFKAGVGYDALYSTVFVMTMTLSLH